MTNLLRTFFDSTQNECPPTSNELEDKLESSRLPSVVFPSLPLAFALSWCQRDTTVLSD